MVTPSARREMATKAVTHYAISIRLACRIFKVSESCYRYQPVLVDENQEIADWLLRITASQRVTVHRDGVDSTNSSGNG